MYKQIIIARKDLQMSPGKLAAQVSHASIAFLTTMIKEESERMYNAIEKVTVYYLETHFNKDLYEQWINGSFTKVVLEAKNKNNLLKAQTMANLLGMKENEDYFLIRDNCYTELTPEDNDGRTLTCIGFKPMDSEIIDQIGKKFHTYT